MELSFEVKNELEPKKKHSRIAWKDKEGVTLNLRRILIDYERIRQAVEHVLNDHDSFSCFY